MLIAIASVNGAPGVTTAALALSAHWRSDEAVPTVVECDPKGGDLALRHGLKLHPGLSDVAATIASGTRDRAGVLDEGVQTIHTAGSPVPVVVASPGGGETRSALPVLTGPDTKALNPPDVVVVADLGRLDPAGPAWPVAISADLVLVIVDGTLGGVGHLRFRLDQIRSLETLGTPVVLAVREADYTSRDVADAFLAQGLDLKLIGPLGPAVSNTGSGRGHRRARRAARWVALAAAVAEAAGEGPLALTAAEAINAEEAT